MSLPISNVTRHIVKYLGHAINIARKERKMSESELAERLGVRETFVQEIQKGDPNIAVGSYIEAATILGIPLLGGDANHIRNLTSMLGYMNRLIPERTRNKDLHDDF